MLESNNYYIERQEIGFKNYIENMICSVIGRGLLNGDISPLECEKYEDYEKFVDDIYEQCSPRIMNYIRNCVEKQVHC